MNMKRCVLMGLCSVFLFVGCSDDKDVAEFNKPAIYWYQQIANSAARGDMDKADAYFISLKSEHIRSPLIPTALIMLAQAHMQEEEYLLANYYLDEYNKRFGGEQNIEYIDFMKLQASFLGVKDVYKDQKLVLDSIETAKSYTNRHADSAYTPFVGTILTRLYMSQYLLNENIASLYDRIGKEGAAKLYRAKNKGSVVELADITPPEQSIIGEIFD